MARKPRARKPRRKCTSSNVQRERCKKLAGHSGDHKSGSSQWANVKRSDAEGAKTRGAYRLVGTDWWQRQTHVKCKQCGMPTVDEATAKGKRLTRCASCGLFSSQAMPRQNVVPRVVSGGLPTLGRRK